MLCKSCALDLPESSFYLHSNGKIRLTCKTCFIEKQKPIDKEAQNKKMRFWREKNKEKTRTSYKNWREKNKNKCRERSRTYIINKTQAMPSWVNREEIKKIYEECPPGYHVDHIIPLKGKNVSGLHVPWNLQYLTASENLKKRNHYETD